MNADDITNLLTEGHFNMRNCRTDTVSISNTRMRSMNADDITNLLTEGHFGSSNPSRLVAVSNTSRVAAAGRLVLRNSWISSSEILSTAHCIASRQRSFSSCSNSSSVIPGGTGSSGKWAAKSAARSSFILYSVCGGAVVTGWLAATLSCVVG